MTDERMNELLDKSNKDTITPDEELELYRALNAGVTQLRSIISKIPDPVEGETV